MMPSMGQAAFGGGFVGAPQGFPYGAPFGGGAPIGSPYLPGMNMMPGQAGGVPGANAGNTGTGRTVYVGNLPSEASVDELLNLVRFGPIENVRVLPEKSCAFISFIDGGTAAAFHADACVKKLSLYGSELKIGWGKPSSCPPMVLAAVTQNQATRNVYLGQLDEELTEEELRDDLSRFGPIDQVKIVRDKNIGFVHFLSISTAIKAVNTLPHEEAWQGKRVNYGKDRCAYIPKSQQQNQQHNHQAAAIGLAAAASLGYPTALGVGAFQHFGGGENQPGFNPAMAANSAALSQMGNRTVYLGNIHSETTAEEICNHIRGGILQSIRFIPEKHIAFVTFVDPNAALAFFHLASYSGVMIHNRRLKIGWGKHSGPLSPAIAMAVQSGGSRNVYIGNIENADLLTEEKLRRDFGDFGEVEQVNSLREKNCAFVNFCNIQNAIKAIEAMKNHQDYQNVKIAYGKDRCGNPPRSVTQNQPRRSSTGAGAMLSSAGATPSAAADDSLERRSPPAGGEDEASAAAGVGAVAGAKE